ncbi:hypothetical protein WMF18_17195 [Sorangium sp. So ce315]|uniref:hypothetical protein n=1 Tax=Sorangium sp. So ce315 TaxID=3133299 RepID=UPI003F5D7B30
MQLEAWATAQGGVRAAARALGVAASTLSRWIAGGQVPRGDGDRGPAWLEERTGVEASAWEVIEAQAAPSRRSPSPRAAAGPGRGRPRVEPPVRALPPSPPARPRRAPSPPPARGAARAAAPPPATTSPALEPDDADDEDRPPATLPELQARARQIPGELQRLRRRIASGAVAVNAGEVMARMLEREARALASAITAAGTATVEEVEQLRALVLDVTRGCEGCRARVTSALRGSAA